MKYPAKITPALVRALSMATRVKPGYFGILPKNTKTDFKKRDRVSFRDAMTFADQLQPHVKRLGTLRAAALCGVTPRSLQLWIRGEGNPNLATQAGALAILRKAKK
ncbi:MAG TPA: hypothetical protein VMR25_14610 [Planctomycetaceae bacterium]|nr:hypothetical protein [Planctomycetaceae bacterium]